MPRGQWVHHAWRLAAVLLAINLTSACKASPASAADQTPATAPATGPADEADAWLDRIAAVHKDVHALRAELVYDRIQGLLGDQQRRFGTLDYVAGPPAKFAIHFDRLLADERMEKQDRWYIFDGRWLVERLDDRKQFIGQEVEPPPGSTSPTAENAPGGGVDPLAMGQGPFVVPISPDKDRILSRYEVVVVPAAEDDPPNSLHLRLTPRQGQRISFTSADLWYDRETLMPQRVQTIDDSENQSIVKLSKVEVNPNVADDLFSTAPPQERGWDVQLSPWEEKPTSPAVIPPSEHP